jgi:hypothetical protein
VLGREFLGLQTSRTTSLLRNIAVLSASGAHISVDIAVSQADRWRACQ